MSVTRIFDMKSVHYHAQALDWMNHRLWGYQDICSVNNATLNRFFSLHYILPFLLAALVVAHLIAQI